MCYVYLTASQKHGTLYLGVTNNLVRHIHEHKTKVAPGFTAQYNVTHLVWFECYDDPINAISREKDIKKWRRDWKIRLIEEEKPGLAGSVFLYYSVGCGVWIPGSRPNGRAPE